MKEIINQNNQLIIEKIKGLDQDQDQDRLELNIDMKKKEIIKIRRMISDEKPMKIQKRETM